MSDQTIYVNLDEGRIVETRAERPTQPPQWGGESSVWITYVPDTEVSSLRDEIERLNARLKVLQDAQMTAVNRDHRNLFKYTDEVKAALWGGDK